MISKYIYKNKKKLKSQKKHPHIHEWGKIETKTKKNKKVWKKLKKKPIWIYTDKQKEQLNIHW